MRIIFADDHSLIRESLRPFLDKLADDVEVLEADDLSGALEAATYAPPPDLILLDLKMPGMNGLDGIKKMTAACPDTPVVILSGQFDSEEIKESLRVGASGYIPKTTSGASLLSALRLVLSGEKYLPAAVMSEDAVATPSSDSGYEKNGDTSMPELSERQFRVLQQVVEGKTYKEIARMVDLAEITIKVEVRKIYKKIGAANRSQAVRIATRCGL